MFFVHKSFILSIDTFFKATANIRPSLTILNLKSIFLTLTIIHIHTLNIKHHDFCLRLPQCRVHSYQFSKLFLIGLLLSFPSLSTSTTTLIPSQWPWTRPFLVPQSTNAAFATAVGLNLLDLVFPSLALIHNCEVCDGRKRNVGT